MTWRDERGLIESALGRKMHEIGKAQKVFQAAQQKLQTLQTEANKLDETLGKLDGK